LSIPGIYGEVKRPDWVRVHAQNERGKPVDMEAQGFLARVFCHELDHLDGILFIQKAVSGTIINRNAETLEAEVK
ncbi:MAG TPA: hypothetical protein GXZ64_06390, partial [Clostridiaceae bacterium]|nr:hypothetical protein [Clostridiaceae bacterium]